MLGSQDAFSKAQHDASQVSLWNHIQASQKIHSLFPEACYIVSGVVPANQPKTVRFANFRGRSPELVPEPPTIWLP